MGMFNENSMYRYIGQIDYMRGHNRPILFSDPDTPDKPPIMLNVLNDKLAHYLTEIFLRRVPESKARMMLLYNEFCELLAVVFLSGEGKNPAKVIAQAVTHEFSDKVKLFGPACEVDPENPEPMSDEDFDAWIKFAREAGYDKAEIDPESYRV